MPNFGGLPSDLESATVYELSALDYVRGALFRQSEDLGPGFEISLAQRVSRGVFSRIGANMSARIGGSGEAASAALDRLRPLFFTAAFKVHDLVVEWILRDSIPAVPWRFKEKLSKYDQLSARSALKQPTPLAQDAELSTAFWETYRALEPLRSALTHRGGFGVSEQGDLVFPAAVGGAPLTTREQGAYLRGVCLLCRVLSGSLQWDTRTQDITRAAWAVLQSRHAKTAIQADRVVLESLRVELCPANVIGSDPLVVDVDCAELEEFMKRQCVVGGDATLHFSLAIEAVTSRGRACWSFPSELRPRTVIRLCEGDSATDRWLTWRFEAEVPPSRYD